MRTNSGGYILVLGDRRSAFAGPLLRVSRLEGAQWLARARLLLRRGRALPPGLRLRSSHYAENPAAVRAQLDAVLGPRFAARGRAGEGRLRRALSRALAEDLVRIEARFDPQTGLFRTPGDALPAPVKSLVARLAAEIVARTPEMRRILAEDLRRPYALGLVWPLLGAALASRGLPALYRAEAWRALARALAGRHFTDAEMEAVLAAVAARPAEYRIGAWEYERFARRADAEATPGLGRAAFFLRAPREHMKRGLEDYRRRVHFSAAVRLAVWSFRLLQIAAFAAVSAAALWLLLRVEGGLMPGLLLLFAFGAAILAGRLYRRPDMARRLGHVGERDLAEFHAALEETLESAPAAAQVTEPAETPQPAEPTPAAAAPEAAKETEAPVPAAPLPPADSPAPVPVAAALAPAMEPAAAALPVPAAEPSTTLQPAAPAMKGAPASPESVLTAADVARAYMAMPIGPIPFPVPCLPAGWKPDAGPTEQSVKAKTDAQDAAVVTAGRDEGADGIFVLGWGMPIPVPNWMAASAPDATPPAPRPATAAPEAQTGGQGAQADTAAAINHARVFHATPLPPVLPSAAFWGIEGASLQPGAEPGPGDGDGPRHGHS